MEPTQVYLGTPAVAQTQVYAVPAEQKMIVKQFILSNTAVADARITVTVNAVDVMKSYLVPTGKTEVLNVSMVLNSNDTLSLQQDTASAINVMVNGLLD